MTLQYSTLIYPDEGACIFLECSSDDPTVRDEVTRKVMKTVTESNLLPPETANGLFPGVIVVRVCALYRCTGQIMCCKVQQLL